MAKYIDYDLIIVEYGINALTSQQSDYSQYGKLMLEVIARVRQCYPNADILLMGIGDRGQKQGSVVHSIATAQNMVDMQRDIARRAQVVFWDTREAMGGEDAIVKWREAKHVNADYIHLNHEGGSVLAQEFINSLKQYMTSK
jgi:lysophospholipase L1-like esterase